MVFPVLGKGEYLVISGTIHSRSDFMLELRTQKAIKTALLGVRAYRDQVINGVLARILVHGRSWFTRSMNPPSNHFLSPQIYNCKGLYLVVRVTPTLSS